MPIHNAIIEKLRAGSIKNVVLFADCEKVPPTPYVIVKPEVGIIPGTRQYRIFAYMKQGYLDILEKYIFTELYELLIKDNDGNKVKLIDDDGRVYWLKCGDWSDVRTEDSDKTIVMERIMYIPFKI